MTRLVRGGERLVRGAEYVDRDGREHVVEADVVVLAANAIGTARLLLLSADAQRRRTGSRTRAASSGGG